jgi:hypothetical protein
MLPYSLDKRLTDGGAVLSHIVVILTASVVYWSEFLATDPEIRVGFPEK